MQDSKIIISRRDFMAYGAATSASLLFPSLPAAARGMDALMLLRLHPSRFFAGLLFDLGKAVVVQMASNFIVSAMASGNAYASSSNSLRWRSSSLGIANVGNESLHGFRHPNFKASTVILGVVDYEMHKKRKIALRLKTPQQTARFSKVLNYLRDEGLSVKLADDEHSYKLGLDITPDDFFTLDYIVYGENKEMHYQILKEITGTTAFDQWQS